MQTNLSCRYHRGITHHSTGPVQKAAQCRLVLRVCLARHVTTPSSASPGAGFRRAEGQENGKGIVARQGLKEAESKGSDDIIMVAANERPLPVFMYTS